MEECSGMRARVLEFRKLREDEIDVKVGNVTASGYSLLLYKNARVDMAILDETVGIENWQRDHKEVKENLYCGVGIWFEEKSQWVWKWDCGSESAFGDKEKGEASDSFKRACFNWGIGRELYTSPFIFISCETILDGKIYKLNKDEKKRRFKVAKISYNGKGEITTLKIVDNKGVIVFSVGEETKPNNLQKEWVFKGGRFNGLTMFEASAKEDFNDYIELLKQANKFDAEMEKEYNLMLKLKGNGEVREKEIVKCN